jgi:methylthioribose-1-phosphate isomerase
MKVIEWVGNKVRLLDQTRLPQNEVYIELRRYQDIAAAIRELKIRGAPAIGVAAAYGIVLGALEINARSRENFLEKLQSVSRNLIATRPTARNLFWAVARMERVANTGTDILQIKNLLAAEAIKIQSEQGEADKRLSELGASLIPDGATILTHCNTGALATAGYGTALGAILQAKEQGKNIKVLVTETRPLLQGARITTWELKRTGIPFTLITDSMAGYFMARGEVTCVFVGADRIAANGDTANKIGTYSLAVLAMEHGIPFYVAAPISTIDPSTPSGADIPIEMRSPDEVTHIMGVPITPKGVEAANPAFDITPARYITAIITEKGILKEPYIEEIKKVPV